MTIKTDKFALITAAALLLGATACSHKSNGADAALAADLKAAGGSGIELAPSGNPGQVVVSALEGGPQSAPKKAAPQHVYKPAAHAPERVAAATQPVPQPTPQPATQTVAPAAPPVITPQPAPVQPTPTAANRPTPVQSQQRQPGTYKTEAEIFSKMPWIRP